MAVDRWQLFKAGFKQGWGSLNPEERSKLFSTSVMLGGIAVAVIIVVTVFIRSN